MVDVEIRKRPARVQVLQNRLDGMLALSAASALEYADNLQGATGVVVKSYRGRHDKKEIWKFDSALEAAIRKTLKQAAIEEGQWNEKRDVSSSANAALVKANLLKGRDRVAAEKKAALARGRDLVRIACFWGMLGYPGRAQSVIEAQPSATKLLAKDTSNSAPIRLATQG